MPPAHALARPPAARAAKAKATFPRPTAGPLRPAVHSQTQRYNTKIRAGRGFTLAELKARPPAGAPARPDAARADASPRAPEQEAGIPVKYAPTIGIAVDHRRKNRSEEGLQARTRRARALRTAARAGDVPNGGGAAVAAALRSPTLRARAPWLRVHAG